MIFSELDLTQDYVNRMQVATDIFYNEVKGPFLHVYTCFCANYASLIRILRYFGNIFFYKQCVTVCTNSVCKLKMYGIYMSCFVCYCSGY